MKPIHNSRFSIYPGRKSNALSFKVDPQREPELAISELVKVFGPDRIQYRDRLDQFNRRLLSLRTRDRKLIHSSRGDHECYDLSHDPDEQRNLYPNTEGFEDLIDKAPYYFDRMEKFYLSNREKIDGNIDNEEIDEAVASQLKSMGYM